MKPEDLKDRVRKAGVVYKVCRNRRQDAYNAYLEALQRERLAFEDFMHVRMRRDKRSNGAADAAWEVAALVE